MGFFYSITFIMKGIFKAMNSLIVAVYYTLSVFCFKDETSQILLRN